ncbi:hypothetical protein ACFWO6_30840, partial [Paenibacillus glucanolyticus]|uniref:hypothetical protein n=1 Tax=Paenibacillus glucanolyticus TaxID=59843 RepID=UPI00365F5D80
MRVAVSQPGIEEVADGSSYARVIDALAQAGALSGPPGRSQTYSKCPAHDDHEPSLSVTWGIDEAKGGGRTLLRCHRDCANADILAVLGLTFSDLYDTPPFRGRGTGTAGTTGRAKRRGRAGTDSVPGTPGGTGAGTGTTGGTGTGTTPGTVTVPGTDSVPGTTAGTGTVTAAGTASAPGTDAGTAGGTGRLELVATYPYTDTDGVLLYDVRRWRNGKAKFSCRTYTRTGRVAAKKAPKPERRVLYNLPAVVAAETVYLDEGEKDADSVAAAIREAAVDATAATSAPFGACDTPGRQKSIWLPQYTEALRGKHVRIVTDRDLAGYLHALFVFDQLQG